MASNQEPTSGLPADILRGPIEFRLPVNGDFELLADLQSRSAHEDDHDPLSTMESLPSASDLQKLSDSASYFCVVEWNGEIAGYGTLRWWDEDSGTRVVLCDWYLAAKFRKMNIAVLEHLERRASALDFTDEIKARTVIGTNASSVQVHRAEAIQASGYTETFRMVEMEAHELFAAEGTMPRGLELRKATPEDAAKLVDLTQRVWAGRDYFTMPTVESFGDWLRRSDLNLFDVAVKDQEIVAFVASIARSGFAEIDDVQVDPRLQRQGIANMLIARNFQSVKALGFDVVRLHTEGHDPAGARSLYEKLGFRVVRSYMRYRKPLTNGVL